MINGKADEDRLGSNTGDSSLCVNVKDSLTVVVRKTGNCTKRLNNVGDLGVGALWLEEMVIYYSQGWGP